MFFKGLFLMLSSSNGVLNTKMFMHTLKKLIIRPLAVDVDDFWLRTSQLWTSTTLLSVSHSERTGSTLWADVVIIKSNRIVIILKDIAILEISHNSSGNLNYGICGTTTSHLKW